MPYIGKEPVIGEFIELDALTASATADYALTRNGAAYKPATVNNLLVSINGVIQAGSTMSLNGNTLTVGATLSSSDTIDFVRVLGSVGNVSEPTDGSVTSAKLATNAVTSAKLDTNIDIAGTLDSTGVITADAGIKLGNGTDILSAYDEGTWNATYIGSSSSPSTPVTATGKYTRIGRLVFAQVLFINKNTSGASGYLTITGLPFANGSDSVATGNIMANRGVDISPTPVAFTPYIPANSTNIDFYYTTDQANWGRVYVSANSDMYLYLSVTYTV